MPWVYIGTSPLKCAYVWTTAVKCIYVWTTKVRPTNPSIDFLLIWWGGWGGWHSNSCVRCGTWWGWAWWVICRTSYEISPWSYCVCIWAWGNWWSSSWWGVWWNSTFNWLTAYWGGWWAWSWANTTWWSGWWWTSAVSSYCSWCAWCSWQWNRWWNGRIFSWNACRFGGGGWGYGSAWGTAQRAPNQWPYISWCGWTWICTCIWGKVECFAWGWDGGIWMSWAECGCVYWYCYWWGRTWQDATCYGWGWWGNAWGWWHKWYQWVFIVRYACGTANITWGNCKVLCNWYCIHCFTSNGTLTVS